MPTINLDVFDVVPGARSATVTPINGAAVTSTVQWFQEDATPQDQQVGAGAGSAINRRVVAYIRRDAVPTLQPGSTIAGGPEHLQKTWRVHSVDVSDPDYHIAVVL